jgi:hypothetical protein
LLIATAESLKQVQMPEKQKKILLLSSRVFDYALILKVDCDGQENCRIVSENLKY